jgi:hypothetical protein
VDWNLFHTYLRPKVARRLHDSHLGFVDFQ